MQNQSLSVRINSLKNKLRKTINTAFDLEVIRSSSMNPITYYAAKFIDSEHFRGYFECRASENGILSERLKHINMQIRSLEVAISFSLYKLA